MRPEGFDPPAYSEAPRPHLKYGRGLCVRKGSTPPPTVRRPHHTSRVCSGRLSVRQPSGDSNPIQLEVELTARAAGVHRAANPKRKAEQPSNDKKNAGKVKGEFKKRSETSRGGERTARDKSKWSEAYET